MPLLFSLFLALSLALGFPSFNSCIATDHEIIPHRKLGNAPCPFNFGALRKLLVDVHKLITFHAVQTECMYTLQAIRLLRSDYLQRTGYFFPPANASEACWDSFESLVDEFIPGFSVRPTCGYKTSLISESCMNITTRAQFESLISESELKEIRGKCNQSLENDSPCASCIHSLSSVNSSFYRANDGKVSDCASYPYVYAAAFANQLGPLGPTDLGTSKCLFMLDFNSDGGKTKKKRIIDWVVPVSCVIGIFGAVLLVWICWRRHKKWREKREIFNPTERGLFSGMEMIGGNNSVIKFTLDEVKKATKNFSWENLIGCGGYGNVYKGLLSDGSEVALKRFKNCSAAGDESFAHEVEIIASVKHVNLVALRGYCTATVPPEGHQRIIVCDLICNGSLYDHLFRSGVKKLSWPIRQNIALGVARGLAYLHYGVQPSIIHRDVKASNILLDETFEAKLADFGLAKFTPDGLSHLSTQVAGTLGYVAPEYALYGQLSERSDVYSFGVVLLELLSGKNAVISINSDGASLLTDWGWSLVKEGRALDVIDDGMPELGLPEVLEKYVLVAVLSSHPLAHARPTMDQIVKILESDFPVPLIHDRPVTLLTEIAGKEQSTSSSGSTFMSSTAGYQPFFFKSDHPILNHTDNEGSSQ
ncbi:probable LRR receptor-like serine/threonine-protein kinase RKF3 [Fagus crenata]